MYKRIGFVILIFLTSLGQMKSQLADDKVEDIENIVQGIMNDVSSYQKKQMYRDDFTVRLAFVKDKILKIVVVETKEKELNKRTEWFFLNGLPLFCDQAIKNMQTNKIVYRDRFYLLKGTLIVWLRSDGKPADPKSPEFSKAQNSLLENGKKLYEEAMK